jgi:hypothetical protein
MLDIPINALTLFAVIITKPQQFGPSWMTIAVSLVCLFAVVIAIRGDGRSGPSDARWASRRIRD